MKGQRTYNVIFETVKTGEKRTVRVVSTDGLNATRAVYKSFGGRKINVVSVKVVKKDE